MGVDLKNRREDTPQKVNKNLPWREVLQKLVGLRVRYGCARELNKQAIALTVQQPTMPHEAYLLRVVINIIGLAMNLSFIPAVRKFFTD